MRNLSIGILFGVIAIAASCSRPADNANSAAPPTSLSQVSAVRLNFRYEADVPGPTDQLPSNIEERNAAVQADFDQNRPQEILDKTITSPDKKHVAAVFHRVSDVNAEYRIDMYSGEGGLIRKITPDTMAVHFPDTILWSPDSSALAFVAMIRAGQEEGNQAPSLPQVPNPIANSTVNPDETSTPVVTPTPAPAAPAVLTFRTEQIYLCDAEGANLKPVTQSEGKIYFYYVWSPDSSMLAALVTTSPEWASMQGQAQQKKELFVPAGRPRLVEKNGRERLLDDAMTQTRPVWSPDSSKIAAAFDTQIRIYDANGNTPTQAAIPLRNQLLISSQAYDKQLEQQAAAENTVTNVNDQQATSAPATTTLPDPSKLVSFNPIVVLQWTSPDILYFQTGYVKQFENPADNRTSYLRWHRLIFSPQPTQQPAR
jgi:hypothetical protein